MTRRRRATSRTGTVTRAVERRDGTWAVRLKWYDARGSRCSETVYGPDAKKAREHGRRRLHRLLQEAAEERAGVRVPERPRPPTLVEVVLRAEREYLPTRQTPDGVIRTLAALAHYWEASFGPRPVDEITAAGVRAVLAAMRAAGKSPAYCNRVLSALSVVLEAAVEWGHLEANPARARGLRQREPRKIPRFLSDDEAAAFLDVVEGQWRALFTFLLLTGARCSEGTGLRWRDVDPVRRVAHIRTAKTGGRTVRLHPRVLEVLGRPGAPDDLVFPSVRARRGAAGSRDATRDRITTPQRALTRALRAAGVARHLSVHDLRHTYATLYLWQGGNLRKLQDQLGHTTPTMTFRYLHVVDAMTRRKGPPRINLLDEE